MFSTRVDTEGGTRICRLSGELDSFTAAALREVLAGLASVRAVVLDLSGVVFIDSSGLGALVGGVRRARELGGAVALASPTRAVDRVLRVAGLDRIVAITATV